MTEFVYILADGSTEPNGFVAAAYDRAGLPVESEVRFGRARFRVCEHVPHVEKHWRWPSNEVLLRWEVPEGELMDWLESEPSDPIRGDFRGAFLELGHGAEHFCIVLERSRGHLRRTIHVEPEEIAREIERAWSDVDLDLQVLLPPLPRGA